MQFVPVPTRPEHLRATSRHWLPFLEGISRRSKEPIEELLGLIVSGRVQIALVWDGKKAHAFVGMQYKKRGDELIAEIIWLTGRGMREWRHLLPEMERYLKEHMGCAIIRPICRPGWSRLIRAQGYKTTHLVMEKAL
jgi:hypothetical protein